MTDPYNFMTCDTLVKFPNPPPPADWQVRLTPGGYVTFRPSVGNVPNWFHRQMQRLCFGVVWERVPQAKRVGSE